MELYVHTHTGSYLLTIIQFKKKKAVIITTDLIITCTRTISVNI